MIAVATLSVTRARQGDRQAVEQVLQDVGPVVLRCIRGLLGAGPDVEDVMQEALLTVARSLPSFRAEGSIQGFAACIATRTAIAHVKRRVHRKKTEAEIAQLHVVECEPEDSGAARREHFQRALQALPEAQAEALVMRFVMGCSLEEIASACGAPPNTIRSRIRLGKEALRRIVERDPELRESIRGGS